MTTTPTSGAADLPEALRVPLDSLHADAGYLCGRLLNGSLTQEQVVESIRRRIDAAKLAALTAQAISKAPDHVAEVGNMVEQAISAEPAGAGYAELPESLMLAVDRWFADNTGLGGCSGKDVRGLAELFYDVTYEGGRESVDDALAIVESFGPGIGGLNDTYARQVLLAAEVTRLRGIYKSAVAGRASMRDALRASHGQAPAHVLHLVNDAFAEVAMAYPKAFALHKVGIADTAVRKALAAYTPQAADSVQEDAARLDFLIEQRAYVVSDPDACPGYWLHWARPDGRTWVQGDKHPTPRAAIDAVRKQGATNDR